MGLMKRGYFQKSPAELIASTANERHANISKQSKSTPTETFTALGVPKTLTGSHTQRY